MKILVAEDNAVSGTLITGVLTRHGYTIVLARNGSEALGFLNSDPDIQGVITDIMMPESSGLDLLRALREHETWRSLPAIVITVRDDHETVAEAFALGCKDYLLKPIRPDLLLEKGGERLPARESNLDESVSRDESILRKLGGLSEDCNEFRVPSGPRHLGSEELVP